MVQVAVTLVAAVGDVRRFATPQQLMARLGLIASERTNGDTVQRGSITKTGNHRARVLIEGPWTYRFSARVGRDLARLKDFPLSICSPGRHRSACAPPLLSAYSQWHEDPRCDRRSHALFAASIRSRGGGCYSRGTGHKETESQNSHLCCMARVLAGTCALSPAGTSDITTSLCSV
jgi:Transposase IS116/IS110/IS902 family